MGNDVSLETIEISDLAAIDDLRSEWDGLIHRSRSGSIFQAWEWIAACLQHFARGRKLALVCVRDGGRLVGLAPFEITSMYGLPLKRLQFIGTGVSDYMDFVLDPEMEHTVLESIFGWLRRNEHRWDLLDLQNFPEGSPTLRWLADIREDGWYCEIVEGEVCPYLPLEESWEDMLPRFGKKMRYNLGYYERLVRREFKEVAITPLSQHELDEGMDAFFRLHTQRWRKRGLPGVLTGASKQGFHREVAQLCLKRGWLRLHGVRLDGDLHAILYCFVYKGKGYYYLGGFEPKLSKYSLGTVLTGHAIKDTIHHGCREFDFLRGNEPYKSRWTDLHTTNSRLIIRKNTLRSKMASSICRLEQKIEHKVKHEIHKRFGAG